MPELASAPLTIMGCPPMRHALRRPRSPASRPEYQRLPQQAFILLRYRSGRAVSEMARRWLQVAPGQLLTCPSDELKVCREPTKRKLGPITTFSAKYAHRNSEPSVP